MKYLISKRKQRKGFTVAEAIIAGAIVVIVLLPVTALFYRSVVLMHKANQLSTAQHEALTGLHKMTSDLRKATGFIAIDSTIGNSWIICTTYRHDTVSYFRNSVDSTLRRNKTASLSTLGSEIVAKYVTGLTLAFYEDTTYRSTYSINSIAAIRITLSVSVPGSEQFPLTMSSLVWSRNRRSVYAPGPTP